jgi:thymidylate synthase (FAD)
VRIIEPSFEILDVKTQEDGIKLLRRVEYLARISHRSEEKQTEDSWKRVLQSAVMEKGDWSVTEHCIVTVIARVDRGVTHEWVRHRIGSYTQESTRFVNYGNKDIEFIKPSFAGDDPVDASAAWNAVMYESEQAYKEQLQMGQSPQIARSVLPFATASTIAVTYNLRNWRFFFMSRDTRETHPDFRRLVDLILGEFQRLIPILYSDLEPGLKQSISFSRPR